MLHTTRAAPSRKYVRNQRTNANAGALNSLFHANLTRCTGARGTHTSFTRAGPVAPLMHLTMRADALDCMQMRAPTHPRTVHPNHCAPAGRRQETATL